MNTIPKELRSLVDHLKDLARTDKLSNVVHCLAHACEEMAEMEIWGGVRFNKNQREIMRTASEALHIVYDETKKVKL